MPLAVLAGILPKGALRYLRQKRQRPSQHWTDVWREEHAVAFTVAQMTQDAMLGEVHQALLDALRKGETLETFRARLGPLLEKRGWAPRGRGGDIPTRLKRIYNTNLRTARAAGQWDRISKNADLLPYLVYELGPSEQHREEHAAWAGLCLKVGDPWWNTHYPPNGWGCKCRVRQVAKPPKDSTTKAPKVETRDWTNPATGEVRQVAQGIDPGWDYHVGAQRTQGVNLGWLRRVEAAAAGRGPAAAARMVERHVKGPGFRWFVRRPRTAEVPRREARPDLVEATPVAVLPEAAVADLGASSAVVRLTEPAMHAQAVGRAGVPARLYARLQEVLEAKPQRQAGDTQRWTFTRTLDVGGERRRARVMLELRDGAPEVVSLELAPSPSAWPAKGRRRGGLGKRDEARLDQAATDYLHAMPLGEQDAVRGHTRGADRLNTLLRSGESLPASISRDVDRIHRAIEAAPAPPPPAIVYRGVSYRIGDVKGGETITLDGLVSTSVTPSVAAGFARRGGVPELFEIRPKKGIYVKPMSAYKQENEFLLRHGSRYRVVGVDEAHISRDGSDSPHLRKKYRIVQIEEL